MSHHYALPLRLTAAGGLLTLTEDTTAEVAQSVQVLLATRVGERRSEPTYGSADPLFGALTPERAGASSADVDTGAIARWEQRAAGLLDVTATPTY